MVSRDVAVEQSVTSGDRALHNGIGVGVRKRDTTLPERFNTAIDHVVADGTYDRIRAKYFPFDIEWPT